MRILILLILVFGDVFAETTTRPTNVKCVVLDPSYCAYEKCELNVLGRGIISINIKAILLKGSFNNAKVNLSVFRKYNGYRPYMFNTTIDFCDFMSRRTNKISFSKIILDFARDSSNLNHSCPYEKEIILKDLVLKESYFKFLPLPSGEYQLQVMAATGGEWKTRIYINIMRQEDISKI